jgi:hypothetical protein
MQRDYQFLSTYVNICEGLIKSCDDELFERAVESCLIRSSVEPDESAITFKLIGFAL